MLDERVWKMGRMPDVRGLKTEKAGELVAREGVFVMEAAVWTCVQDKSRAATIDVSRRESRVRVDQHVLRRFATRCWVVQHLHCSLTILARFLIALSATPREFLLTLSRFKRPMSAAFTSAI